MAHGERLLGLAELGEVGDENKGHLRGLPCFCQYCDGMG